MKYILYIVSWLLILTFVLPSVCALSDENLKWLGGNTYKLTPKDNMVTEKEYTFKAVEFPAPVRGVRVINGTVPERPVTAFVRLELYRDIVNNSSPIDTFSLGVGGEYITSDRGLKITLASAPGNMSQSWVYEYYNPWASIKIQKRAIPILSTYFRLNDTKENVIDPGDYFKVNIRIKNIGNDTANNINYDIDSGSLIVKSTSTILKDTIGKLDKDEQKSIEIMFMAPAIVEGRNYNISVNTTGYDSLGIFYSWNASKTIKVRNITDSIMVNKTTKKSIYLKENINVILSITNVGPMSMNNIKIYDSIPDKLLLVKDNVMYKNTTEFYVDKNSLGSGESFTHIYALKPVDPGIYVLPKFKINFSIDGKEIDLTSNEQGFRVFGPKVTLNKLIMYKGNDIIDVKIEARNIGNGFATMVTINDQLPENATLISGDNRMVTSLDVEEGKIMNYTIKIPEFRGVSSTSWPPAVATYYLDDYMFSTSSEGMTEEIYKELFKNESTDMLVNETPKKVVATIPLPTETPKKGILGFRFYESIAGMVIMILLGKKIIKNIKINRKGDEK